MLQMCGKCCPHQEKNTTTHPQHHESITLLMEKRDPSQRHVNKMMRLWRKTRSGATSLTHFLQTAQQNRMNAIFPSYGERRQTSASATPTVGEHSSMPTPALINGALSCACRKNEKTLNSLNILIHWVSDQAEQCMLNKKKLVEILSLVKERQGEH